MARRNPIRIVNWSDRHAHRGGLYGRGEFQRFILSFGAYGTTHLMVFETSLEDALELAADYLADHMPGHIMLHGHGNDKRDPELDELMAEACAERTPPLPWPVPEGCDDFEPYWDVEQDAYADLMYTERGYLTSYEWCITAENPSHAAVLEIAGDTGW